MATSPNGRFVKAEVDIWMDRSGNMKITSKDPDLHRHGGIYLTAKKGTKTRQALHDLHAELTNGHNHSCNCT